MSESHTTAKRVGLLLVVTGIIWLFMFCLRPLGEWLFDHGQSGSALKVVLPLCAGAPGGVLCYLGWQLARGEVTRISIKNALGMLTGMAICMASFGISLALNRLALPEWTSGGLIAALFLSTIVGLPTYAYLAKRLMHTSEVVVVKGEFVGRGSYQMLAWMLFFVLSPILMEFSLQFETDSIVDFGFILAPFLIPYALYRLAAKYLVRDTVEAELALDYPDWKSE